MAALFLVLTPLILVFGSPLDGLIYFPLALINILLGTIGIVSILATSQVFFRDTKFIVPFFTSIMFFLTPIFYPRNFVPSGFQWAVDMNPLYGLINPMRMCIFEFNREAFFFELGKGVMWSTLFVILAIVVWRSKKNEFYLQL
jgi:ABC-type polysaccharide/polyol phosphate export permease